jgi:peptide-methionine (S)-S-oxide reductase
VTKGDFMRFALVSGGVAAAMLMLSAPGSAEKAVPIPAAIVNAPEPGATAVAVLAGGCFWGVEAVFEAVKGVTSVSSGYAGGTAATANYEAVSGERTSHAEAVRITYDPRKVSYATLLRVYFSIAHDPTQLNRQGPDTGTSYRSAIFPQNPGQDKAARAYIAQLTKAKSYPRAIVTRIEAGKFYPAEAYHQDFMRRNPSHPYITRWDRPKLAAYKAAFPNLAR